MDIYGMDFMDLEDLDVIRRARRRDRNRIRINPFELDDDVFKTKYRFTKRFCYKIVYLVRGELEHDPRGCPLSPEFQVVCALRNWARHEIQDDTGDLHGVSQPTVSVVCKNVAGILARISSRFIQMPATLNQQEDTMRKFRDIANFPTVIGAIDCTHIKIKRKVGELGQIYINRKGYPSINVQVVCDANLKIMDIVTRWRGSVHDSRIFRESRIKQRCEAGAFPGLLLGDLGYPCTLYLFTPVRHPRTPQEERYNRSHIRTRNTVERCFGVLKQRFRCLLRGMYGDIDTAKKTIVACAVLHNIAIDMNKDLFPGEDVQPASPEHHVVEYRNIGIARGIIRRRQFIETHFN